MAGVRKYMSVGEIQQMFENCESDEEDVVEVFMEPPDEGLNSGEDSGDEDGPGMLYNLPATQLKAQAELVIRAPYDEDLHCRELEDQELTQYITDVLENSYNNISRNFLEDTSSEENEKSTQEEQLDHKVNNPSSSQEICPLSLKIKHQISIPDSRTMATSTPRKVDVRTTNIRLPDSQALPKPKRAKKAKTPAVIWLDGDAMPKKSIFPGGSFKDCSGLEPYQQFEKFFDDEVLQLLCNETNHFCIVSDDKHLSPNITIQEMRVFKAIMIITGYSSRPTKRDYWCEDSDMYCLMIANSMRRNRFETIFRNIHFIDNSKEDRTDKTWKIRPITDAIKARLLKHFHPEQNLSYDESMVEYYGRHGCKQFIRGKPIRFGYKMWSLNTPQGYLINFEMYQGNNPRLRPEYEKKYGKNAAPLFNMIDDLHETIKPLAFSFHFDNLFTSTAVLLGLKERGYDGTGTVRENMIPKSCPLTEKKVLKKQKKPRGYMECKKIEGADIFITKWVDNNIVTVASTIYGMNPISKVSCYSREQGKKIEIKRPFSIAQYNNHMGGTDRMDQNVNAYRIGARGKKWWWSIFTWLIDVSLQNAWILHRKGGSNISKIQFRRAVTSYYCQTLGVIKPPGDTDTQKRTTSSATPGMTA